jgi:hypothetical protein
MGSSKEIFFDIMSNDDTTIIRAIASFNQIYKTDFEVVEFIYDEVIFAKIKTLNSSLSDIFHLGAYFNSVANLLRQKGEIDW